MNNESMIQDENGQELNNKNTWLKKIWQSLKSIKLSIKNISIFAVASFIVGAIPAYYAIIDHQTPPEETINEKQLLIDSINVSIKEIESKLHPEIIPQQLDSTKEYSIIRIKNFQILSLEIINFWKQLEAKPSLINLNEKDEKTIFDIYMTWNEKRNACLESCDSLSQIMLELDEYGRTLSVSQYVMNQSLFNEINDLESKYEKVKEKYKERYDILNNIIIERQTAAGRPVYPGYKDDLIKLIKIDEEATSCIEGYRMINKILSFILTQNENYDIPLRKYLLGYKNPD